MVECSVCQRACVCVCAHARTCAFVCMGVCLCVSVCVQRTAPAVSHAGDFAHFHFYQVFYVHVR